jgi:adenylate cyclase
MRLACQTLAHGPLRLRRLVLDEMDLALASDAARDAESVGREENVALLFSDVADFTPFSEALPAYDVVHTLDRWFTAAGEEVQRAGGRIDNYMGDGFLAVFPEAAMAVRAGLGLLAAAERLSGYTQALYGLPFLTRVGIHQGAVVVGTLGAAHNRRATVIGDVVNLAARIEAANKELGTRLLVSGTVEETLEEGFVRGRRSEMALKGKSGVHALVEILEERP